MNEETKECFQREAEECVEKVRERQMGYWFENMEKMDIQEERRNTARARADAEKAKADVLEKSVQSIVAVCRKYGASREQTIADLIENCQIDQKTAKDKVSQYWEKNN